MLMRLVVVMMVLIAGNSIAMAAQLEILEKQEVGETSPLHESLPPCDNPVTVNQTITIVGPLNQMATVEQNGSAAVVGADPSCQLNTQVQMTQMATFQIMPDVGENNGDPVRMCVEFSTSQTAQADPNGPYSAAAILGDGSFNQAYTIKRNQQAVFVDGPTSTPSDNTRSREVVCQFPARIGDEIEVRAGMSLRAEGSGIGSAEATGEQDLDLTLGGCDEARLCFVPAPVGVPAVSKLTLGVIALILASIGVWFQLAPRLG